MCGRDNMADMATQFVVQGSFTTILQGQLKLDAGLVRGLSSVYFDNVFLILHGLK